MKIQFLIATVLALCTFQLKAQYRFWGLSGSNVQGSTIGGNAIIIGTATATAPNNVIIGNGTGHLNTTSNGGNVFIGANAKCGVSNALILGPDGTSGTRVNVGIGTAYPTAHLHSVHNGPENIVFSTTGNANYSKLNMKAPGNDAFLFTNGNTMTGTHLAAVGAAPAVPDANLAGLITNGTPLPIGVDGGDNNGPIHIINWVTNNIGQPSRAECMRIDNTTGYVGVHTRRTGNGRPQALFHVNLTNPINSNLDPLTQGIRFQGLPAAQARHTEVVTIDPLTGDLARGTGGGGGVETDPHSWHVNGNTSPSNNIFGTLTPQEVRLFTNGAQRGRFTVDGNFDFGANAIANSSTSAAVGTNNITSATSVIAAGTGNTIDNSSYSAAVGDGNNVQGGSTGSQATGEDNNLTDVDNSSIVGKQNTIDLSYAVLAAGEGHTILSSHSVAALGARDRIEHSDESVVAGEDNEMYNAHGCFIGGGHNYSDGAYNFVGGSHNRADGSHNMLLGHHLVGDISSSTPVSPNPSDPTPYVIVMGERINSNLTRSLSVGFNGNRTTVTTERGMSVQIDPASGNTDIPVVNFEVEAGVTTTGRLPLGALGVQSNVRFHNLPPDPQGRALPAVLIDPATGELFQSQNSYMKPGKGSSDADMDALHEENEALKERLSQLESQLSMYDEKFAQLERSLNQICESGCEGLKTRQSDVLYQSVPNPSDNHAKINYYLSRNYSEASIALYGLDGKELNSYMLTPGKGDGSVNITLGDLPPGVYLYKLMVDGRQVSVKKLQKQ